METAIIFYAALVLFVIFFISGVLKILERKDIRERTSQDSIRFSSIPPTSRPDQTPIEKKEDYVNVS
jgi:hypothetical protein